MQPKCTNTTSTTSNSNSIGSSRSMGLLEPPERFKEVCLRAGGETSKDTAAVLEYFFDPEKELGGTKIDLDLLKLYLTGGISFESFKNKSI